MEGTSVRFVIPWHLWINAKSETVSADYAAARPGQVKSEKRLTVLAVTVFVACSSRNVVATDLAILSVSGQYTLDPRLTRCTQACDGSQWCAGILVLGYLGLNL